MVNYMFKPNKRLLFYRFSLFRSTFFWHKCLLYKKKVVSLLAKRIYTMLSMDTYMRGMGGYHLRCMATCMAAYSAKAAVEYCVRNVLCIRGFTPPRWHTQRLRRAG